MSTTDSATVSLQAPEAQATTEMKREKSLRRPLGERDTEGCYPIKRLPCFYEGKVPPEYQYFELKVDGHLLNIVRIISQGIRHFLSRCLRREFQDTSVSLYGGAVLAILRTGTKSMLPFPLHINDLDFHVDCTPEEMPYHTHAASSIRSFNPVAILDVPISS